MHGARRNPPVQSPPEKTYTHRSIGIPRQQSMAELGTDSVRSQDDLAAEASAKRIGMRVAVLKRRNVSVHSHIRTSR